MCFGVFEVLCEVCAVIDAVRLMHVNQHTHSTCTPPPPSLTTTTLTHHHHPHSHPLFQPAGDVDQLTKLLGPFLRITKTSPQFTVEIAQHGFVPVVLELLKKQHAPAQRDLLSIIHVIYEHYPRPKVSPQVVVIQGFGG